MTATTIAAKPTFFLLKPNPLFYPPNRFQFFFLPSHKIPPLAPFRQTHNSNKFPSSIVLLDAYGKDQCNTTIKFKTNDDDDSTEIQEKTSPPMEELAFIVLSKALEYPGNPVTMAAVLLTPMLSLMHDPKLALAASGGVMGGSSFSSSYSSESSSSSSYSSSGSYSSESSFSSFSESSSSSSYRSSESYSYISDSNSNPSPAELLQASLKKSYAVRKKSYPRRTSLDRYAVTSKRSYTALSSSLSEEEVYSLSSSVSQAQVVGNTGPTVVAWVFLLVLLLVMSILAFAFYNSTRDMVSTAEKKCRYTVPTQRITILKLQGLYPKEVLQYNFFENAFKKQSPES